jgi:benzoylformate decarboxylase
MLGAPPATQLERATELLLEAESPILVAGDAAGFTACGDDLARLSELLGMPSHWAPGTSMASFPATSPCHRGPIFPNGQSFERTFAGADLAVFAGADVTPPIIFAGTDVVPTSCRILAVAESPADPLGARIPDVSVNGDLGTTARALLESVQKALDSDPEIAARVAERRREIVGDGRSASGTLRRRSLPADGDAPLTGRAAVATILEAAPTDVIVVDEAVSHTGWVTLMGDYPDARSYLNPSRGGALGNALGVAIGAQIGSPDRRVLAIAGDGATLYGPQGLWTIANNNLPIVVCVLDNDGYSILKDFIRDEYFSPELGGKPPSDDADLGKLGIEGPSVDIVGLSESLGVPAVRVTDATALRAALESAFEADAPRLIDVAVIDRHARD